MYNPKKMVTWGTREEGKKNKNKNTTQYVLDTTSTIHKQTQVM